MKHASALFTVLVFIASGLAACTSPAPPSSGTPAPAASANPADNDWPMPNKDMSASRYSGLAQITGANVKDLRPAWSLSTGVLRGHEGEPIVVGGTM